MCRKLIFVCVLLLGLVSNSYGTAVVIGDWEAASYDGWSGNVSGVVAVPSLTTGVTLNKGSLGVYVPQQWVPVDTYWALKRDGVVNLTGQTEIKLDVTFIASEWQVNWNWLKVDKLAINSAAGWREFSPTAIDRVTGLPTSLDWGPWLPDAYRTYSWDISGQDWSGVTDWMTIIVALQNPNAFATGFFYLDNAQVIPEPTTIALLGLGGLSLLRIRKRR
jgi:hypothetical protein